MEIIVGTFFIIYLIVFLCREGIKSLGKDAPMMCLGIFDILSVVALWWAMLNAVEEYTGIYITLLVLTIPAFFGFLLLVVTVQRKWNDLSQGFEHHRKMGLVRLSNKSNLSGDIDFNWLDKEKNPQKWAWLKK